MIWRGPMSRYTWESMSPSGPPWPGTSIDFRGAEAVYHLAAVMRFGRRNRTLLHRVNVEGCRHVVRACREGGVGTLVHVSTIAALGYPGPGDPPADESAAADWTRDRHAHYGQSKKQGEDIVLGADIPGLRAMVGLPGIMLGAGDPKSVPMYKMGLGKKGRGARFLVVPRGGTSYVDVRDVARGLVALQENGVHGERCLLTAHNLTHRRLFEAIAGRAPRSRATRVLELPAPLGSAIAPVAGLLEHVVPTDVPLSREGVAKLFQYRFYTSARAAERLGWRPQYSLAETLDDAITWYCRHGVL